jgi:cobalt-zinc-cadmium efflux system protein
MKPQNNRKHVDNPHKKASGSILAAFLLNLTFSVFELIGGILTGSVAILSDAVHDVGDAMSIGFSFLLEKESRRPPDDTHTYGYLRYSVLGGLITTVILLVGSGLVIQNAIHRLLTPTAVHYNGMILFAVVGVVINLTAALMTHRGATLNRRAVTLHLLEDVLGWVTVLIGAVTMRLTDWVFLDPILSIGVAVFILISAVRTLREILDLFLERTPREVDLTALRTHLSEVKGVVEIHHFHLRSLDGVRHDATLHAVLDGNPAEVKSALRRELAEHGIIHATIETETLGEVCGEEECRIEATEGREHHHHHD